MEEVSTWMKGKGQVSVYHLFKKNQHFKTKFMTALGSQRIGEKLSKGDLEKLKKLEKYKEGNNSALEHNIQKFFKAIVKFEQVQKNTDVLRQSILPGTSPLKGLKVSFKKDQQQQYNFNNASINMNDKNIGNSSIKNEYIANLSYGDKDISDAYLIDYSANAKCIEEKTLRTTKFLSISETQKNLMKDYLSKIQHLNGEKLKWKYFTLVVIIAFCNIFYTVFGDGIRIKSNNEKEYYIGLGLKWLKFTFIVIIAFAIRSFYNCKNGVIYFLCLNLIVCGVIITEVIALNGFENLYHSLITTLEVILIMDAAFQGGLLTLINAIWFQGLVFSWFIAGYIIS